MTRNGFTMVELLIVILVMAIAATAVVMTFAPNDRRAMETAQMLAGKTAGLRDQAILQSRPMGLWVTASGYGFETWDGTAWQPLDEAPFAANENWPAGVVLTSAGAERSGVRFNSVGMPSGPISLGLADEDGGRATVTVSANGDVGAI